MKKGKVDQRWKGYGKYLATCLALCKDRQWYV